jgi:hypothetical protein
VLHDGGIVGKIKQRKGMGFGKASQRGRGAKSRNVGAPWESGRETCSDNTYFLLCVLKTV